MLNLYRSGWDARHVETSTVDAATRARSRCESHPPHRSQDLADRDSRRRRRNRAQLANRRDGHQHSRPGGGMTAHWIRCSGLTIGVVVDNAGLIVDAPELVEGFIGQPFKNLLNWLEHFELSDEDF